MQLSARVHEAPPVAALRERYRPHIPDSSTVPESAPSGWAETSHLMTLKRGNHVARAARAPL